MDSQLKELQDVVQQQQKEIIANNAVNHDLKNEIKTLRRHLCEEIANLKGKDNGSLIWPIANFKKQQQKEKEGTEDYLLSEPFRTNPFGYEVEAQLFLNGNSIGSGSHLSVYIHFLESSYEPIRRPFFISLQLSLLDQSNRPLSEKHDIVWNWEPFLDSIDEGHSKNLIYGAPEFFPLSVLERDDTYLRNDTLFLKLEVRPLQSVMRDFFSNDGTLTWIVDNVPQRRLDEADGLFSWTASKKFYSAPRGRRLGAVLKFNYNGDNGPGDNLGIFVRLYKGEFDSQLKPIFPMRITYTIINQSRHTSSEVSDLPDLTDIKFVDYKGVVEPTEIARKMSELTDTYFPYKEIEKAPYMVDNRIVMKLIVESL